MWIHTFTVVGKFAFPLDMLRYDSCHPHRSEDVSEMEDAMDRQTTHDRFHPPTGVKVGNPYRIEFARYGTTKADAERTTIGRWISFGWSVDPRCRQSRKV